MQFTEAKMGRIFIIRLHDNDHLPDVLEDFAAEQNVSSAVCFLLGGVKPESHVIVGPRESYSLPPEPVITKLNGTSEVCGLGTIFLDEERKPKLHMHASFGRGEKSLTGCVRAGVDIWHLGEVILIELTDNTAKRAIDEKTGFEFLEVS